MPAVSSAWSSSDVKQRSQVLGVCFVLTVAVIWVAASFLVQNLEQQGLNPFLLTYIANSLFVVLVPVSIASSGGQNVAQPRSVTQSLHPEDSHLLADGGVAQTSSNSSGGSDIHSWTWKQKFGDVRLRHAAMLVAPLWFGAQLAFNFSLSMTNVTSNTILSSTSGLFTYGASCLLLGEVYTLVKLLFILVCIAGVAMVTFADSTSEGDHSLLGDMLCLLSSMLCAMYTVTIRKMLPDDCHADVAGLFGLIGLLNLLCMAPVLVLLWFTSIVQLQGLTVRLIFLAVCKGLFDNVLSDYLWVRAVLLTGPTIATVGLSIQVPLAVLAEACFTQPAWLSHHGLTALMGLGALAVILGFLGVTLSPSVSTAPQAPPSEDAEMFAPRSANVM